MRTNLLALGVALLTLSLAGCIPAQTPPVMDQAGASCFVADDGAVLMLPIQVSRDMALAELELVDPDGLELEAYTVVQADDEPFATGRPPTADDLDAMQTAGPAEPAIVVPSGASWLVAVVSTEDGGGSAGGLRLTWDDDEEPQDARLVIEVGSVCSM